MAKCVVSIAPAPLLNDNTANIENGKNRSGSINIVEKLDFMCVYATFSGERRSCPQSLCFVIVGPSLKIARF